MLNDRRVTPSHRLRDDVDYQPTRRLVLFGVHFAAIAGPGPLIGPVLAAQWGFLPGFAWIVIGACLAGGVHDFVVLVASVRFNGLSLPKIARNLLGPIAGTATTIATLFIIVATLGRRGHRGCQYAQGKRLGHVHYRGHDPRGTGHGLLDVQDPPRAASARPR